MFLKIFEKLKGPFFHKGAGLQAAALLKRCSDKGVLLQVFKKHFSAAQLRTTSSGYRFIKTTKTGSQIFLAFLKSVSNTGDEEVALSETFFALFSLLTTTKCNGIKSDFCLYYQNSVIKIFIFLQSWNVLNM